MKISEVEKLNRILFLICRDIFPNAGVFEFEIDLNDYMSNFNN